MAEDLDGEEAAAKKQSLEVGKVPAERTTDRRMFLRSEPTDDGRSMCVSVLTKKFGGGSNRRH